MMTSGPQLFARYAYPPNSWVLRPRDHLSLFEYGAAGSPMPVWSSWRRDSRGMALPRAHRGATRIRTPGPPGRRGLLGGQSLLDPSVP